MASLLNTRLGAQTRYILRVVWQDLMQRKLGTFLTILVIAASLTIPTISYLLWKNINYAKTEFYPEPELTLYLNKNLSDNEANIVVEKIRQFETDKIEHLNFISRQQSLEDFQTWSGFAEALDIIEDNPLPAVVVLKPKKAFANNDEMLTLRNGLQNIKGVQEVRLDNGWLEKLTALTWLFARIGTLFTLLMMIAVFLVIGNVVRTDVANSRASIEVQQLLGATDHFIARPFLYKGMIYGFLGSLLALLFSTVIISYLVGVVKYVTDMFTVKFELTGLDFSEIFLIIVMCIFIGWVAANIATNKHIIALGRR